MSPGIWSYGQERPTALKQFRSWRSDPSVPTFVRHDRGPRNDVTVTEVVIHESVTATARQADSVLLANGYGVHFAVEPSGLVTQHNDLRDCLWHCDSRHNPCSVAIEVINPYYDDHDPDTLGIAAPWAHRGHYEVPPLVQLESLHLLIQELLLDRSILHIAPTWPGLSGNLFRLGGFSKGIMPPAGGIWAHHYTWAHSDGAFPAFYCWLRAVVRLSPEAAYPEAIARATGSDGWVHVSDLARRQG